MHWFKPNLSGDILRMSVTPWQTEFAEAKL
jgi:hypothetical protein